MLQLVNSQKCEKTVSDKNIKNKLKFLYVQEKLKTSKLLEEINYSSYLDICIKSVKNTHFIQTKESYLVSFDKTDSMFDFRKQIISEFVTNFKNSYKNMILVSENQVTIYK